MIQRYFFILRISAPCFLLAIFLSVFLFIPNSLFCQDQINVLFSSIDTTLCDTTAAFPYPVLSYIEILYKDANTKGTYPLHGLAAKDRWLVSGDTTEKGELIDLVWNKLEEYHQEDDMIPMLRNIKEPDESVVKRDPTWAIKEVADSVGTSVVLAMDYSGSMDDFSRLEDAARVYVELMSGNDRTAIIKFTDTVDVFLDFTNNKNSLRSAISDMPPDADGSPIWDVLYRSITQCADEPGYLAVVIFTDGVNSIGSYSTNYSMQEVIAHANLNNVDVNVLEALVKYKPYSPGRMD